LDREYLEDYEQKELSECWKFERDVNEGRFSFETDRFPPDTRFVDLHQPVASAITLGTTKEGSLWAQVPFCGSLLITLPPFSKSSFEQVYFKTSEIPKIISFIKETGRLQIALSEPATMYEGLDYLDPFFKELNPPEYFKVPMSILGDEKEIQRVAHIFDALGRVKFFGYLRKKCLSYGSRTYSIVRSRSFDYYATLKLGHYAVAEDIENLLIDDPEKAFAMLNICEKFIGFPITDMRSNLMNFTTEDIRRAHRLPLVYRPQEIQFPCEIGKFLLKKLTFAPEGLRACNELIDEYNAYDLRKVAESLNDAIIKNHPDIINRSAEEFSEILNNIWNDSMIPRRIKGIRIGIPLSVAAIGSVAAGPIGAIVGGFLAELGFKVAEKTVEELFDKGEGLSEKLAKLRTKSYQTNLYDFKKKYKSRINPT
jgi:hypothetical protein